MSIKLNVLGTAAGTDALTRKEGVDGLTVQFDGEPAVFLSWRSFRQILSFKTAGPKPEAKPAPNGPALAVK